VREEQVHALATKQETEDALENAPGSFGCRRDAGRSPLQSFTAAESTKETAAEIEVTLTTVLLLHNQTLGSG